MADISCDNIVENTENLYSSDILFHILEKFTNEFQFYSKNVFRSDVELTAMWYLVLKTSYVYSMTNVGKNQQ